MIDMEHNRYIKNAESVRKIAELFGLRLLSFDPDWTFAVFVVEDSNQPRFAFEVVSQSMLSNYNIKDDFMGKVAILMNLPWEFDPSDEELKSNVDTYNGMIYDIGKYRPVVPEDLKSDSECKEKIEHIESMMDSLDKQSKEEFQSKLNRVNTILTIREGLKNYMKDKFLMSL